MHILIGLICIVCGVINVVSPETGWYLSHGWQYRDAEPSDGALLWGRVGGVIAILLGILICFGLIGLS